MTEEKTNKLYEIFMARVQEIKEETPLAAKGRCPSHDRHLNSLNVEERWADYLNGLDCTYLDGDEFENEFVGLVNDKCFDGQVCIEDPFSSFLFHSPAQKKNYILIPRDFAEKVLVLGLP